MNPTREEIAVAAQSLTDVRPEEFTIGFEFEFGNKFTHEHFARELSNCSALSQWPIGVVSASYTAHRRGPFKDRYKAWHVTSDGSLCCGRDYPYSIELISPAFGSLSEGIHTFEEVLSFLRTPRRFTNQTCGLHVTFGHSRINDAFSYLDPIKLAWALNDQQVLSAFRRRSNYYCSSYADASVRLIRRELTLPGDNLVYLGEGYYRHKVDLGTGPKLTKETFRDLMVTGRTRSRLAFKNNHHLSVSLCKAQHGLVEFRAMGGNYLCIPTKKMTNTIQHMANSLAVAIDHSALERQYVRDIAEWCLEPTQKARRR